VCDNDNTSLFDLPKNPDVSFDPANKEEETNKKVLSSSISPKLLIEKIAKKSKNVEKEIKIKQHRVGTIVSRVKRMSN